MLNNTYEELKLESPLEHNFPSVIDVTTMQFSFPTSIILISQICQVIFLIFK